MYVHAYKFIKNYSEESCTAGLSTHLKSSRVAWTHMAISNSRETVLRAFASAAEVLEPEGQVGHDHQLQYTQLKPPHQKMPLLPV